MPFYQFSQNNSGGCFAQDDEVDSLVIIEAANAQSANDRARSLGIYFDGVSDDIDCPCCGDRWSATVESDATPVPSYYNKPIESYFQNGKSIPTDIPRYGEWWHIVNCWIYFANSSKPVRPVDVDWKGINDVGSAI